MFRKCLPINQILTDVTNGKGGGSGRDGGGSGRDGGGSGRDGGGSIAQGMLVHK
jgi:hypothetical protein